MKKKVKAMSAAELMQSLAEDSAYQSAEREREQQRAAQLEALIAMQSPLLAELRLVALDVTSVWDLVDADYDYSVAVPVLLKHLTLPYPDRVLEGIARALAIPAPNEVWKCLKSAYESTDESRNPQFKEGLAVALAAAATPEQFGELLGLIRNNVHGESRLILISRLKKSRDRVIKAALDEIASSFK